MDFKISELNNRNWLDLPDSIFCIISEKLMKIQDYIHFGAVCKSFRSIYCENRVNRLPRDPILLMLPPQHNTDSHGNNNQEERSLYSLSDKKVLDFQVSVPHNREFFGSNDGWLITYSKNFKLHLVNPFLSINNDIELPPMPYWEPYLDMFVKTQLSQFRDGDTGNHLLKAVLIGNPTSDPNYVVIASHGYLERLSIFKAATRSWTHLDSNYKFIQDVIFYQDKAYAVNYYGHVITFDINDPNLEVETLSLASRRTFFGKTYLVLSEGNLFQVVRKRGDQSEGYKTILFTVLKVDRNFCKWKEVRNIGGRMFFIGDNCSLSASVSDLPGCKPNCIYFTDEYRGGYLHKDGDRRYEMGVFYLKNGKIEFEAHCPMKSNTMFPSAPVFIQSPLR